MQNENKENCCSGHDAVPRQPKESFSAPGPYPPVRVCERNSLYGRMMRSQHPYILQ